MAKKGKGGNVAAAVRDIAEPAARALGLDLWDICFVKEGSGWVLRIFIDKPGGIFISDCEAMSHAIDAPLDELDPIEQSYTLEVCSPGIERELKRPEHFAQSLGQAIKIQLYTPHPVTGSRDIEGILRGFENGALSLEPRGDTGMLNIQIKDTVKIKVGCDFGGILEK